MAGEFGPNSVAIESFLDQLARLSLAQFTDAIRTWREALRRTDAWYAAEDAVGEALARTARHDEEWRLHDRLYEIFRSSAWHADVDVERAAGSEHAPSSEPAAQYLAGTAAFALLVFDALSGAHLATLYAPFATLIPLASLGLRAPGAGQSEGRRGLAS
jgi:hypothetical protein